MRFACWAVVVVIPTGSAVTATPISFDTAVSTALA
jgi:hypothetical protein